MDSEVKRKYHHGDLRRAVIEAAIDLTRTQGPSEWTMRQVAQAAGVSVAAPYRHFRDKEAVLVAIALEGFRALENSVADVLQTVPTHKEDEAFSRIAGAYFAFSTEFPEYFRLMFSTGLRRTEHPELGSASRRLYGQFESAFRSTRSPDAAMTAYCLVQGIGQMHVLGALDALDHGHADLLGNITKTLLQGLLPRD